MPELVELMEREDVLFVRCEDWPNGNCPDSGLKEFFQKMIDEEGQIRKNLAPKEIAGFNAVCGRCDIALETYEKKCPVCGGTSLSVPEIPMIELDTLKIYYYTCDSCRRELYLYK